MPAPKRGIPRGKTSPSGSYLWVEGEERILRLKKVIDIDGKVRHLVEIVNMK